MSRLENPPFLRGETFYNGATIDSNNLGGTELEGCTFEFDDTDNSVQGVRPKRSNRKVLCQIIRNVSTAVLLPKRLATASLTSGVYGCRADGMADVLAEDCLGVVDEWLPAAGAAVNDLLWVVIKGPTLCTTFATGGIGFAVGERVIAATAAASTGGTATGKITGSSTAITGATTPLADAIRNVIGRAITARTSGEVNTDTLILVGERGI